MIATLALTLALFQDPPAAAAPAGYRPEEIEQMRMRTAYLLAPEAFEGDVVLTYLSFDDFSVTQLRLEAEYGALEWLQAQLRVPILRFDPDKGDAESGVGDLALEGKAKLPLKDVPFELAAGAELEIPTGDDDEGLGRGELALEGFGAMSWEFEQFTLHFSLSHEVARHFRPVYRLDAAIDWRPFEEPVSLMAAINGEFVGSEETRISLVPGGEYRIDNVALGIGFPIGLTGDAADWGAILAAEAQF